MADGIHLRTALDKGSRPLEGEFLTTVLIELTPPRRTGRLPLNLGLLVDTSESMGGEKLRAARLACLQLIEALDPLDVVSVVSFNSQATALVRGQAPGEETRLAAERTLAGLRAEGVTSLLRGLEEVYREVRRHAEPGRSSFVILLSDGYPTTSQGYIDEETDSYVRRADREMRESGISLTTIGLGDARNYEQSFLRRLADAGNGQMLYCPDPTELRQQFAREFQRLQKTVLSEVELEVTHLIGEIRRLWRVYPDKKLFPRPAVVDGACRVPIGAFQDEQPQAFLLDVVTRVGEPAVPGRRRLLEAGARWRREGEPQRVAMPVIVEYTNDERALRQRNPEVVRLATECVDALLEEQLEAAVASGDRVRQTAVLARKKQLTKQLGKAEATRVLEEMEDSLARGESISQDALARSSVATRPTRRLG